jgi:hypothetical protein
MTQHDEAFDKCVTRSHGGKSIDCRLGLWGIHACNIEDAEREARHYWIQYFRDGEYDALLQPQQP